MWNHFPSENGESQSPAVELNHMSERSACAKHRNSTLGDKLLRFSESWKDGRKKLKVLTWNSLNRSKHTPPSVVLLAERNLQRLNASVNAWPSCQSAAWHGAHGQLHRLCKRPWHCNIYIITSKGATAAEVLSGLFVVAVLIKTFFFVVVFFRQTASSSLLHTVLHLTTESCSLKATTTSFTSYRFSLRFSFKFNITNQKKRLMGGFFFFVDSWWCSNQLKPGRSWLDCFSTTSGSGWKLLSGAKMQLVLGMEM